MWKSEARLFSIVKLILRDVISVHDEAELHDTFEIVEKFRVTLQRSVKHDFAMAVLDKRTSSFGLILNCNKQIVKEAVVQCMEEARFLARARNISDVWGVATNLYEWKFVHYSKQDELNGQKDFYTVSQSYPCYVNNNRYTYKDMDMKLIVSLLR